MIRLITTKQLKNLMQWETVIGLEVHVQLATKTKLFSGAPVNYGFEPNTSVSLLDLGMPGVLPALNLEAVRLAIKFGLSIAAEIAPISIFSRKHYFYPDLPKGYQITQHALPIVKNGHLEIALADNELKRISINRAHLEEDAGKSVHEGLGGLTGIDLNRAGTPLLEIVSAPDLNSAKEAVAYLKTLHTLVRYIEISSANMQEGAFRCDANVSMRPAGNNSLGTRVEIKNLNSFRFVEQAINYEVNRQTKILEQGGIVKQETRFFNAQKKATWPMRIKEEAEDYRYFPDPDLLPLKIEPELIAAVEASMPELPAAKQKRFMQQYGLSTYTATLLATDRELADYFEKVTALAANPKLTANWILGELAAALNRDNCNIKQSKISAEHLADLIRRIADQTISEKIAKLIFVKLWNGDNKHQTVDELITKKQLAQINDKDYLNKIATNILTQHQKEVKSYQAGKKQLFSFFVGQIIQATNGKANPAVVNQLLHDMLF